MPIRSDSGKMNVKLSQLLGHQLLTLESESQEDQKSTVGHLDRDSPAKCGPASIGNDSGVEEMTEKEPDMSNADPAKDTGVLVSSSH